MPEDGKLNRDEVASKGPKKALEHFYERLQLVGALIERVAKDQVSSADLALLATVCLSAREVLALLGISRDSLDRAVKNGDIHPLLFGQGRSGKRSFRLLDVVRLVEGNTSK